MRGQTCVLLRFKSGVWTDSLPTAPAWDSALRRTLKPHMGVRILEEDTVGDEHMEMKIQIETRSEPLNERH